MNGTATITIQGQQVRLKFGMPAVREYFERSITTSLSIDGLYNETGIAVILFAGYKNACVLSETSPTLTFEDFYNLVEEDYTLDDANSQQIIAAIKEFNDSRIVKKFSERLEKVKEDLGEEKKRLIGTTSSPSSVENSDTLQGTITE